MRVHYHLTVTAFARNRARGPRAWGAGVPNLDTFIKRHNRSNSHAESQLWIQRTSEVAIAKMWWMPMPHDATMDVVFATVCNHRYSSVPRRGAALQLWPRAGTDSLAPELRLHSEHAEAQMDQ